MSKTTLAKVDKKVNRLTKIVNQETDRELKHYDKALNAQLSNLGTYSFILSDIPQNLGDSARIAEKIRTKELFLNYQFKRSANAVNTLVGWAVVVDKKPLATPAIVSWANVFNDISPLAFVDFDETDRFKILMSGIHYLNSGTGTSIAKRRKKKINISIEWFGANNLSLNENAIYLIGISDEPTNMPEFQIASRLTYYG